MADRTPTLLVPGSTGDVDLPMLRLVSRAVALRGSTVNPIRWRPSPRLRADPAGWPAWVRGELAGRLDEVGDCLLVGKSLASLAAPLAAERDLPAIWLTPLLARPELAEALAACRRPFLLVGGTGDDFWDGDLARRLTPYVCELPGADHGLELPGRPLAEAVTVLAEVVAAVERFLDEVLWVGRPA